MEEFEVKEVKTHEFLSEELLVPHLNKTDGNRANMFCSHLIQSVVLQNGEAPKVFTGFENQVGKFSRAYRVADKDLRVVAVIVKNSLNALYVVVDAEGRYDVVFHRHAEHITEDYGYVVHDKMRNHQGEKIPKGTLLYRSDSYDDDLNFRYGVNLRAVYLSYHGMTYEDGIVLSASAAEKLKSYSVKEVFCNVNNNDLLLNIYSKDPKTYKSFPDVGEPVVDRILTVRRRQVNDSLLFDMSVKNLMKVNWSTDAVFYSSGIVADIEVFCNNRDLEGLAERPFNRQILRYLKASTKFHERVVEVLGNIVNSNSKEFYSDDLAYLYKRSLDALDPSVVWKDDNSDFSNILIKFTMVSEKPVVVGSKISGRFGNKGCCSMILPDDQMPVVADGPMKGLRAEVILNPFSVVNRLNVSQLFEQETNFFFDQIVAKCKRLWKKGKKQEAEELYFGALQDFVPAQHRKVLAAYQSMDNEGILAFWEDLFQNGAYIHQPPFFGNIDFNRLTEIYGKYDWITPYRFEGIERPLVMGEMYFILLKHHPSTKLSIRSTSYLNIRNVPSKSTTFKDNLQLYSHTPIRLGEMEVTNLLLCNNVEEVVRLLALYSVNEADRKALITALLTGNIFGLDEIPRTGKREDRKILDVYMLALGLKLERSEKDPQK